MEVVLTWDKQAPCHMLKPTDCYFVPQTVLLSDNSSTAILVKISSALMEILDFTPCINPLLNAFLIPP